MTRKDFELIAATIDGLIADDILTGSDAVIVATRFSVALSSTNDRFDADRFYLAATKRLDRKTEVHAKAVDYGSIHDTKTA